MLNIFPIQFLALFAYFLLRVLTGTVLLYLGLLHARSLPTLQDGLTLSWWPYGRLSALVLILTELVTATMLLVGYAAQLAALILILMSVKIFLLRGLLTHDTIPSRPFYVLLLGIALCLFITGAGAFAFDLPV
jgi:uncharacterized membrane protein YphA (DoxX/SURF4 family)